MGGEKGARLKMLGRSLMRGSTVLLEGIDLKWYSEKGARLKMLGRFLNRGSTVHTLQNKWTLISSYYV